MKLFWCNECGTLVHIKIGLLVACYCGKHSAKYLNDNLTAIVTHGAFVVGIDNNTFLPAVQRYRQHHPEGTDPWMIDGQFARIDFFFVGWIPTVPGEVITVDTEKEVEEFPMDFKAPWKTSTMPSSTGKPSPPPDRLVKEGGTTVWDRLKAWGLR